MLLGIVGFFSRGFSGGVQWRFRIPFPASGAVFVKPSAANIISRGLECRYVDVYNPPVV
jgi:hypothetical protein